MKTKIISMALMALSFSIYSCQEEHDSPLTENVQNPDNGIDMSVFAHLDQAIQTRIASLRLSSFPNGIADISVTISNQELNREGDLRTVTITATSGFTIDFSVVDAFTGHEIETMKKQVITTGNTNNDQVTFDFKPWYDQNPYTIRAFEIRYQIHGFNTNFEYLALFHQYAYPMAFTTDLANHNYMIDRDGNPKIQMIRMGEYPSVSGEIAYFFAYESNGIQPVYNVTPTIGSALMFPSNVNDCFINIQPNKDPITGEYQDIRNIDIYYVSKAIVDQANANGKVPQMTKIGSGVQLGQSFEVITLDGGTVMGIQSCAGQAVVFLKYVSGNLPENISITGHSVNHRYYPVNYTLTEAFSKSEEYTVQQYGGFTFGSTYHGYAILNFPAVGPYDGWHPNWEDDITYYPTVGRVGHYQLYYNTNREVKELCTVSQSNYWLKIFNNRGSVTNNIWDFRVSGRWKDRSVQFCAVNDQGQEISGWEYPSYDSPSNANAFVSLTLQPTGGTERYVRIKFRIDSGAEGVIERIWQEGDKTTQYFYGTPRILQY